MTTPLPPTAHARGRLLRTLLVRTNVVRATFERPVRAVGVGHPRDAISRERWTLSGGAGFVPTVAQVSSRADRAFRQVSVARALPSWPHGALQDQAACVLEDGRVLVCGGQQYDAVASSAVFDPFVGTWTTTDDMPGERAQHAAVLLPDGRVLVCGGVTPFGQTSPRCYLFDPRSGAWTKAASLPTNIHGGRPKGLRMHDGRVLLVGGRTASNAATTSAVHAYDPRADRWQTLRSMTMRRDGLGLAELPDGRVLAVGGVGGINEGDIALSACEAYDPMTGAWSSVGGMGAARALAGVVEVSDGRVLAVGGAPRLDGATPLASLEVFDPDTNAWTSAGTLLEAAASPMACELHDGRIAIVGGWDGNIATGRAYTWTPATSDLLQLPLATDAGGQPGRVFGVLARLPSGELLLLGGLSHFGSESWIADPFMLRGLSTTPSWDAAAFTSITSDPGAREVDITLLGALSAGGVYELRAGIEVEEAP